MLTMLHSYCDVSDVVMFTTKENNLLNYFNYKYGIKHYIFSDGDVDDILDSINSLLLGIEGSNDKSVSNVLTSRECEILKHIAEGKTSKEIADELCISKNTVDTHRNKMLQKLNLANSRISCSLCFLNQEWFRRVRLALPKDYIKDSAAAAVFSFYTSTHMVFYDTFRHIQSDTCAF